MFSSVFVSTSEMHLCKERNLSCMIVLFKIQNSLYFAHPFILPLLLSILHSFFCSSCTSVLALDLFRLFSVLLTPSPFPLVNARLWAAFHYEREYILQLS